MTDDAATLRSEMEAHYIAFALAIAVEAITRCQEPTFQDSRVIMQRLFRGWCLKANSTQPQMAVTNGSILQKDAGDLIDILTQRSGQQN